MRKVYLFILVVCGLLLSAAYAGADVTLAVIAPKTGEYATAGHELFNGARLATQEINDNGGLVGEKLDLLTIDDRCDDRLAVSTAEMLTLLNSKKIVLVIGPYCANRFDDVAVIYETGKIFQIVPTTVAYNVASQDKKGQILLLGTKAQISKDFFKFYNDNFAGLKVGFVYNDSPNDGYAEVAQALFSEFRRFGKSDLLKFYPLAGQASDRVDVVSSLVQDKVNVVLVLGETDEVAHFVTEAKNTDKNLILFASKKAMTPKIFSQLGKAAEGIYLIGLPGLKDSLMFTENLVELRLKGIEPQGQEAYGYVAVKLWSDLVKKVNGFAYDKLAEEANSKEMQEKWSEFLMHSGSLKSAKYVIEMFKNGEFKQVY